MGEVSGSKPWVRPATIDSQSGVPLFAAMVGSALPASRHVSHGKRRWARATARHAGPACGPR